MFPQDDKALRLSDLRLGGAARDRREDRQAGRRAPLHRPPGLRRAGGRGPQALRSRNAFDIEGLGDKQIELFFKEGLIKIAADIFTLAARDGQGRPPLSEWEGFGEVSARNLFAAIEARRRIVFNRFLYALGIRHVGETNARRLARHFADFAALQTRRHARPTPPPRSAASTAIGPAVIESIVDFFAEPHNQDGARQAARPGDDRADAGARRPAIRSPARRSSSPARSSA